MRMVIPFQFEKLRKLLPREFGWRLILVRPFSETNAAATRVAREAGQIREILNSGRQSGNGELAGIFEGVEYWHLTDMTGHAEDVCSWGGKADITSSGRYFRL
jgi:hypothetical protein